MLAFWALLTGCGVAGFGNGGGDLPPETNIGMHDYFPFAQNTDCVWEFAHAGLDHGMDASITDTEILGEDEHFEVSFVKACAGSQSCVEGELIRRMRWSVNGRNGVHLQGLDTPEASHSFDPPIQFARRSMAPGEEVETGAYTVTFVGVEDCPVELDTFTSCVRLDLSTVLGVREVAGSYWAVNDFNIVAIDWPDQDGLWQLTFHDLEP